KSKYSSALPTLDARVARRRFAAYSGSSAVFSVMVVVLTSSPLMRRARGCEAELAYQIWNDVQQVERCGNYARTASGFVSRVAGSVSASPTARIRSGVASSLGSAAPIARCGSLGLHAGSGTATPVMSSNDEPRSIV